MPVHLNRPANAAEAKLPDPVTRRPGKDAATLLVVLALALAAVAYINTVGFAFVYDDIPQVIQNPRVHTWEHAPRLFVEHVWSQISGQPGNYYRPFFEFWFLINYTLFGLHPAGWHLATVAVHLLVIGLVYLLLKRVTGDRVTAAIATVLFAVHPTHIESVAWVSGVTDPLCRHGPRLGETDGAALLSRGVPGRRYPRPAIARDRLAPPAREGWLPVTLPPASTVRARSWLV